MVSADLCSISERSTYTGNTRVFYMLRVSTQSGFLPCEVEKFFVAHETPEAVVSPFTLLCEFKKRLMYLPPQGANQEVPTLVCLARV